MNSINETSASNPAPNPAARINPIHGATSARVFPKQTFASNGVGTRLILYARKSTESEDRQVQSIDDQIRLCHEVADANGMSIIRVIHEARSAKAQGTRQGFAQMVSLLEKGKADGVIAWHPDRLARNAVDGGWILDLLDRNKLQTLLFASSYTFENTPEGKFMLGMIFGQSKYYVDKLSKDVRRGLNSKREKGHYPHRAPEGYRNNVVEKTIEADPDRFPLLRKAVDLVLGQTLMPVQVLHTLNEEWGYKTRQTKRTGGGPLSRTTFYDLLSNPFYYGLCREKEMAYWGVHTPLLTEGEFNAIQRILGKTEKRFAQKYAFALTGLIRCGTCGCMITASRAKGHVYYHCTNSRGICDRKGIRQELLIEQALRLLDGLTLPPDLEPLLLQVVERFLREQGQSAQEVNASQHKAIVTANQQLQNLLGMRARDLISDEEYLTERTRLQSEVKQLQQAAEQSQQEVDQVMETAENVIGYAVHARAQFLMGEPNVQRRILEMLGSRFVLAGKTLLLDVHPYLDVMREAKEEWRKMPSFKPLESGSGSTKKTDKNSSVLHGWAERIAIELMEKVKLLHEPFPTLPQQLVRPVREA